VQAQEELERGGGRELRRAAEPAPLRIELAAEGERRVAQDLLGERLAGRRPLARLRERLGQLAGRVGDGAALLAVEPGDRLEDVAERRHPVPRLRRVVGAAVERRAVRGEKDGHRPAAVSGERDDGVHVERIDVGPLLPVDLDVHEAVVHQLRRLVILERLVLHHVAPVAGGVADGEEDRLVLGASPLERLLAPRVPVHWVVSVLEQVGTGLTGEPVHAF
jgi:hypothetical protein